MSENHFVVPVKYYVMTFIVLLILTVLTVYVAEFVDLGKFNFALALFIALVKGGFVVTFFMGLKWDKGFNIAIFLAALVFVFVFFTIVLIDIESRGYIIPEEAIKIDLNTPVQIEK